MVKRSRKQKQSRRSRKQSRRSRKQSRRNLRSRRNQRGGYAPTDAPYEALDGAAARAAAQVSSLDGFISELPSVIPRQGGGRYRRANGNSPTPVWAGPPPPPPSMIGGNAPFNAPYKLGGERRKNRRSRKQRKQRGGQADFNAPYSFGYSLPGVNPQFGNEGSVNSLYSQSRGAQGY
jgi:hypothetical protein